MKEGVRVEGYLYWSLVDDWTDPPYGVNYV